MPALRRGLRPIPFAIALLLVPAGPAAAVDIPATCADLQSKVDAAQHDHVIVLDGVCTGQITLKSFPPPGVVGTYTRWTLKGDPTNGLDGFDRNQTAGRALTGVDVHNLTLQDLVFRDGRQTGNGGAVSVSGESSLAVFTSTFTNNQATGRGGAVYVQKGEQTFGHNLFGVSFFGNTFGSQTTPAQGNRASVGGAVSVELVVGGGNSGVNDNTFANNVAETTGGAYDFALDPGVAENLGVAGNRLLSNTAGGSGGGAHVAVGNATFLRFGNEQYVGNAVEPITGVSHPAGDHFGGGLFVESGGSGVDLNNNVFQDNQVNAFSNGQSYGGGALAIVGDTVNARSEVDRFVGNSVAGQPGGSSFESEGGGVYFAGEGSTYSGWLSAIAANTVGAGGSGGGAYAGAASGTVLEFADSTIAANAAPAFPGLAGGGSGDTLHLENSIVFNPPAPDIGGFATVTSEYSDACMVPGTPFPGTANICADPLLANAAAGDIHQTRQSPTIDRGNDDLFQQQQESPCCDFEGDPRPTDGDGDGHTVDMGADETPAGFAVEQPPPPPPAQTPQCSDGVDNDGDGAIDQADPGCLSGPGDSYAQTDPNEADEGLRELVLCGRRPLSLVRADARGRRVVLRGLVGEALAGQEVDLYVRFLRGGGRPTRLAGVTPEADGQFVARVKGPPRRLFNVARYQARVGDARSVELKLPQSLESTSIKQSGDTIVLRGRVDRPLLGRRNPVVIKRVLCGQYQTVGQARPNRRGVYVVRFRAPELGLAALYRAESRVLARPGGKRYVRQFARAINVALTGQTG